MGEDRKSEYARKFKDPRWQKNRLAVLQRDDFRCQQCDSDTETLHVHHLYYEGHKDPWDYPLSAFLTLCEGCHEDETIALRETERRLLLALKKAGAMSAQIEYIAEALEYGEMKDDAHVLIDRAPLSCIGWHTGRIIALWLAGESRNKREWDFYMAPVLRNQG